MMMVMVMMVMDTMRSLPFFPESPFVNLGLHLDALIHFALLPVYQCVDSILLQDTGVCMCTKQCDDITFLHQHPSICIA